MPKAQPKVLGRPVPNKLSCELAEIPQASGADLIDGADSAVAPAFYGYALTDAAHPLIAIPPRTAEAQKTEPDKNTYAVPSGQKGAEESFDYGTRFVCQGHEAGAPGYITRINLDADRDHRVTLMATKDDQGADLPDFDGSTWDPLAQTLLFTAETNSPSGGVWAKTLDPGTPATDLRGIIGSSGYEGVQNDSAGNLWLVEDNGGTTVGHARQPNSFIYRFVPNDRTDLTAGGKLQVLQVESLANPGEPIVFHIAKAADGTPFKRPENGVFQPGTKFRAFAFTETGDTDIRTEAGSDGGGFGDVQVLEQKSPSADDGRLHLLFQGDAEHAAFDNISWLSDSTVAVVEDRGDTFHSQGTGVQPTAFDSGWAIDAKGRPRKDGRGRRALPRRGPRRVGDRRLGAPRRRRAGLHERRRQRDHGHPHLRRRPDRRRDPRGQGPGAV